MGFHDGMDRRTVHQRDTVGWGNFPRLISRRISSYLSIADNFCATIGGAYTDSSGFAIT